MLLQLCRNKKPIYDKNYRFKFKKLQNHLDGHLNCLLSIPYKESIGLSKYRKTFQNPKPKDHTLQLLYKSFVSVFTSFSNFLQIINHAVLYV